MDFKFEILKDHNLLIQQRKGLYSTQGLMDTVKQCQTHPDYSIKLDMISDFRKVDSDFDIKIFEGFIKKYSETNYLKAKFALIVENPKNTALATIWEYTIKQQYVKLFSTVEGACNWLKLDYSLVKEFFK